MPVVRQRPDPFFGLELWHGGHRSEGLAVGLLFKVLFSVVLLWEVQSLTSVKVSQGSLSLALTSIPPFPVLRRLPSNHRTLFLTTIKHGLVNLL